MHIDSLLLQDHARGGTPNRPNCSIIVPTERDAPRRRHPSCLEMTGPGGANGTTRLDTPDMAAPDLGQQLARGVDHAEPERGGVDSGLSRRQPHSSARLRLPGSAPDRIEQLATVASSQ
jgi:hypothetical protein